MMPMAHKAFWILLLTGLSLPAHSFGQKEPDNSLKQCASLMSEGYVSDGQTYKARLNKNNRARFHTIFYADNRYCLVACSNIEDSPLIMKVYDSERNLLFDNTRHGYTPKWHLDFASTVSCIVEIQVDAREHIDELVKLVIGFKKPHPTQQVPEQ